MAGTNNNTERMNGILPATVLDAAAPSLDTGASGAGAAVGDAVGVSAAAVGDADVTAKGDTVGADVSSSDGEAPVGEAEAERVGAAVDGVIEAGVG
eukprot:6322588-Pyramimonas_sp.AAC.4